jgi:uncharacterized protein
VTAPLPPAFDPWFQARCPDIRPAAARAVLDLAAEGATPSFIARYRRQLTGNLDEAAARRVLQGRALFEKLLSRQSIILESIARHACLTPELRQRIEATFDLDELEDLYYPYRQQKKNRALAAREAGLDPLAEWIWSCGHGQETPQPGQTLDLWAFTFRNPEKGVPDVKAAVEGARDIVVERLAGDPQLRSLVRQTYFGDGWLRATRTDKAKPQSRFEAYFSYQERVASLRQPANSHRYLALRRGQAEGEIQLAVGGEKDDLEFEARLVAAFEAASCSVPDSPGAEVLRHAARIAFKNHVRTSIENEVHRVLKESADEAAAQSFAEGVRRRLLEAPYGPRPVLGVDPAVRTDCKLAVLDGAGVLVTSGVLNLGTDELRAAARDTLARLVREGGCEAVAVGDGAGGREAQLFVRKTLREAGLDLPVVLVSEAGTGAYKTSEAARAELPDVDADVRSAVSIGRRLQDPLAELLKMEPRAIGVGGYHHDLPHAVLQRTLDVAVEECVARVGVNPNTASRHLLARVSGLDPTLAGAIVEHRGKHGPFRSRSQLLEVPLLSPKAFEQSAGFLRLPDGEHPLDRTAVHPELYPALEDLSSRLAKKGVGDLLGEGAVHVRESTELKEQIGEPTWQDVVDELERAGRDPRGDFVPFTFRDDLQKIEDLKPGMLCPGIVSNVTPFGVFVDVGVHHDGLVHISQLPPRPGHDPKETFHAGARVEVRVLKVDLEKKQISLSMRPGPGERRAHAPRRTRAATRRPPAAAAPHGPEAPASARRPRPPGSAAARPPKAGARPRPTPRPADRSGATERRPEGRRPAFNNPFAVLAGLKVAPKRQKS